MSQPTFESSVPTAPRPAGDLYAWVFALVPLGGLLQFGYGAITHDELPDRLASAAYYGAYIALALADVKMLKRAGARRAPNAWWCLLAPAYLVARARALGRGWMFVWIWAAAFVVFLCTYIIPTLGGQFAMLAPTPACAGGFDDDVIGIFDTIPQIKAANVQGAKLTNRAQSSMQGAKRFCQAHVVTNAGGAEISYSFERQQDGQVYVQVRLLN